MSVTRGGLHSLKGHGVEHCTTLSSWAQPFGVSARQTQSWCLASGGSPDYEMNSWRRQNHSQAESSVSVVGSTARHGWDLPVRDLFKAILANFMQFYSALRMMSALSPLRNSTGISTSRFKEEIRRMCGRKGWDNVEGVCAWERWEGSRLHQGKKP